MATKQITDLGATTEFIDGDLLLVRKTAEGIDKKIAQADFIKSFGNPAINGFTAESEAANKLTLTASNDVVVDTYYDGMTACFISDIASNGLVQIKVGGLAYKDFIQYGSVQSVVLTINKYLEAIYVGDNATGKWYQTNVATPTIFTNEYLAAGVVAGDEQSTTYTLNSAIGSTKTVYYNGMSLLFTTDVASKGAVLLNVDGLGVKNLTDQVGDNVSFDLAANETVMAIYNGVNFIKNLFSQVDQPLPPVDPEQPIPPENQEVINVGPGLDIQEIMPAIAQLIESYGENGGNRFVTIQLNATYVGNELIRIQSLTPWITIQTHVNGNTFNDSIRLISGAITLKGTFNVNSTSFLAKSAASNAYAIVKDSTINCTYVGAGVLYCVSCDLDDGFDSSPAIIFENVNVNSFNVLAFAGVSGANGARSRANFKYTTGTVVMAGANGYVIQMSGNISLKDINFGNINRNDSPLIYLTKNFDFNNVSITTSGNHPVLSFFGDVGIGYGSLLNCNMRNTTTNPIRAITTRGAMVIDGGDFRHPNSTNNADILVEGYPSAILTIRNNPLATYEVINPGQTVPPQ